MPTKQLKKLIQYGRDLILRYLSKRDSMLSQELEKYVISWLNAHTNREGDVVHMTKPIHVLAFIMAFEELEQEGAVKVNRHGLPLSMIDNETTFELPKGGL